MYIILTIYVLQIRDKDRSVIAFEPKPPFVIRADSIFHTSTFVFVSNSIHGQPLEERNNNLYLFPYPLYLLNTYDPFLAHFAN